MATRMSNLHNQISNIKSSVEDRLLARNPLLPNDVVICCAIRTPLTKAQKGGMATLYPEDMLAPLFHEIIRRTSIDPQLIDDVCIGNVLQPGGGALSSRIAQILGGIPVTTPTHVTNRQCASGLQAVANVAAQITAGYIKIGLGGGVEAMTHFDMMSTLNPEKISETVFQHDTARDCLLSMGMTSENVARQFSVTREMQDAMAVDSHRKAFEAQEAGRFDEEIVPVLVGGKWISKDDGIRPNTNIHTLEKLKASFTEGGTTTAGNSSQVTDGAALCLLARYDVAKQLNLPVLAKFVCFHAAGVPPSIMGIGPSVAIPALLKKAGLSMNEIDIFEVNEAFASQAHYCVKRLNIPPHKLNPKGGAIALGHPLGATGARMIATLLPELRRTGTRYGIVSMCVGTGMGAAALIENLQR